jgi:5'-3' exonuclease
MDGIEVIQAPFEADAQLAYLSQNKLVDVVVTQDSDLIVYGCDKVWILIWLFKYSFFRLFSSWKRVAIAKFSSRPN